MLGLFADIRAGTNHDRVLTAGVTGITRQGPLCFDDFAGDYACCIGRGY